MWFWSCSPPPVGWSISACAWAIGQPSHRISCAGIAPNLRARNCCGFWAAGQGEGTRHHFRMKVEPYDASLYGLFAWRVEDAFHVLREAGFLLHDDNRGEWTPCNIYRHLMEQGRISTPMPVLSTTPEGYTETTC